MDENLIKKYTDEMFRMHARAVPAAATAEQELARGVGGLTVMVTTLKGLYPVEGARVTVYKGEGQNRLELDSAETDESGKTPVFRLETPSKALSESAGAQELPYETYNISVSADGYLENISLNVPVFPDVVSVQNVDMMLTSAAGDNNGPQINDEKQQYQL